MTDPLVIASRKISVSFKHFSKLISTLSAMKLRYPSNLGLELQLLSAHTRNYSTGQSVSSVFIILFKSMTSLPPGVTLNKILLGWFKDNPVAVIFSLPHTLTFTSSVLYRLS